MTCFHHDGVSATVAVNTGQVTFYFCTICFVQHGRDLSALLRSVLEESPSRQLKVKK